MTRSDLIVLARYIKQRNTESSRVPDSLTLYVYSGRFKNNWIHCVFNDRNVCVSVIYKKVFYAVRATGKEELGALKYLYKHYLCETKVFLYLNTHNVAFFDKYGYERYKRDEYNPQKNDFADLIPLRSTLNVHA